ncbi:MAG: histidine kinase [Lewinellaceae bacterium]|nr:histidine kinase [Lewinellaceae bacterium]
MPHPTSALDLPALRHLCHQLEHWAFTDFNQARTALATLEQVVSADSPFDIRLGLHRTNAFLQNQWQHFDQALEQLDLAASILESLSDNAQLSELWSDRAAIHLNRRDWNAAQECIDQARRLVKGPQSKRLRAQIACREGFMHLHLRNDRSALDQLSEARRLLESMGDHTSLKDRYIQTLVLSGLGDLYERLDDKERSLDAYRQVLPIVETYQLRPRLSWHYLNAGKAALAQSDVMEARQHFDNAVRAAAEGDLEAKAYALANLGILAFLDDNASQSAVFFDEAIGLFQHPAKPSDFVNLSKLESWLAGLLIQQNKTDQAETRLLKAFAYGEQGNDPYSMRQVCQALAEINHSRGAYEAAYSWQSKALALADRYSKEKQNHERQELEARYQLERNRQEARMAKLQVASLQMRALRAQMNPHFLFNVLNAIQGFITSGRNSEAETYLARFAKLIRQSLDYSDLEVVTLEQEIEFIGRYLDINRKLRFRDQLEFSILPPIDCEPEDLQIPTMIVQPFVENAIEHGLRPRQAGTLKISFELSKDEKTLVCTIEDDGVGYNKGRAKQSQKPAFQTHRSRGMEITRERLTLLHQLHKNGAGPFVKITDLADETNGEQQGTRVNVILPLMDLSK